MTNEEYTLEILGISRISRELKRDVAKRYIESRPHLNIGEVVTREDDEVTIKITKVTFRSMFRPYPELVYKGVVLNKDGIPRKDGKTDVVFESEILKI